MASHHPADNFDFSIAYENDDWLAVNKPAPLLVHPTDSSGRYTLLDALKEILCYEIAIGQQIALVNRLDRETSGLMLVSKHTYAARQLGKMIMRHEIEKSYLAIVHGRPQWQYHDCRLPIVRKGEVYPDNPIYVERCCHESGKAARSEFWLVKSFENAHGLFSLIRARAHTGRMHQLRCHLKALGLPMLGDKLYGPDSKLYLHHYEFGMDEYLKKHLLISRHALHAYQLELNWNEQPLSIQAPLPPELADFCGFEL